MENKQYTECYIAFLDILGFKKMIGSISCEEILSIFKRIRKPFEGILTFHTETLIPQETMDSLKMKVMSDSICFHIDATMPNALLSMLISCVAFQFNLLALSEPVLLRGAVVRGQLYAMDDVMFGPGLTQAYLMEECNAKFPRIILTNEVLEYVRQDNPSNKRLLKGLNRGLVFRDTDAFYTLNFVRAFVAWDKEKKVYKNVRRRITEILNSTMDESVREKYLYLEKKIADYYPQEDKSHA